MCDILQLASTWTDADWTSNIYSRLEYGSIKSYSKETEKSIITQCAAELKKGHAQKCYNLALLGIVFSNNNIIDNDNFIKIFQPSTNISNLDGILSISRKLNKTISTMGSSSLIKLKSIEFYIEIYKSTRSLLDLEISKFKAYDINLPSLLEVQDLNFSFKYQDLPSSEFNNLFQTISPEDLSTALSYIINAYPSIRTVNSGGIPLKYLSKSSNIISKFLLHAHIAYTIHEIEPLIFKLNYTISKDGSNYTIIPPDELFAITKELGYIRNQIKSKPNLSTLNHIPSFPDVCREFAEKLKDVIFRVASDDPPRLQSVFPEPAMKIISDHFFGKLLYREEIIDLENETRELTATSQDLLNLNITSHLKLTDIIYISRIFRFLYFTKIAALKPYYKTNKAIFYNSIIGKSTRSQLLELLINFQVDRLKAIDFLELIHYDLKNGTTILDLQYTPLLQYGDLSVLPLGVFSNSNTIRNILSLSRKRLYDNGKFDPITHKIVQSISKLTPHYCENKPYSHAGIDGEVDLLFVINSTLYIFECKNTLLPTSNFELRTLHDYILKASKQLTTIQTALKDITFKTDFSKKIGIDLISVNTVKTAIITNQRVFSGYSIDGHIVRELKELINWIDTGNIVFTINNNKYIFNLAEKFHSAQGALDHYLDSNNIVDQALYSSIDSTINSIKLVDKTLSIKSYPINFEKLATHLSSNSQIWKPIPTG